MFSTAFQVNAFQINAFQIYIPPPSDKSGGDDASWTFEELKRIRKLSAKIAERQRKLEQITKEANAARKQSFRDQIDPVKKPKVQYKQEVKADIPLAETQDLQRSISYLERQRDNILEAVAYRNQQYLIQEQLRVMEAKRQEELDDEQALLLLLN